MNVVLSAWRIVIGHGRDRAACPLDHLARRDPGALGARPDTCYLLRLGSDERGWL